MGAARFRVTFELLREILNLPRGTEIKCVETEYRQGTAEGEAEITVVHQDLAPFVVEKGPPLITPTFRKEYQSVAVFESWNQK